MKTLFLLLIVAALATAGCSTNSSDQSGYQAPNTGRASGGMNSGNGTPGTSGGR